LHQVAVQDRDKDRHHLVPFYRGATGDEIDNLQGDRLAVLVASIASAVMDSFLNDINRQFDLRDYTAEPGF
jgi:hypothetical protein